MAEGQGEIDLIGLDEALAALAEVDERQARLVELRFFGGLTIAETAEVLGTSASWVMQGGPLGGFTVSSRGRRR